MQVIIYCFSLLPISIIILSFIRWEKKEYIYLSTLSDVKLIFKQTVIYWWYLYRREQMYFSMFFCLLEYEQGERVKHLMRQLLLP